MKSLAVISVLAFFCMPAAYGVWIANISPSQPTTTTPVTITVRDGFADPGQEEVSLNHSVNEYAIDIQVVMQDLHSPTVVFPAVYTEYSWTPDLGMLPAGTYSVTASLYMIPWYGGEPEFRDDFTGSFVVAPEPATLGLLALGGLLIVRRHQG